MTRTSFVVHKIGERRAFSRLSEFRRFTARDARRDVSRVWGMWSCRNFKPYGIVLGTDVFSWKLLFCRKVLGREEDPSHNSEEPRWWGGLFHVWCRLKRRELADGQWARRWDTIIWLHYIPSWIASCFCLLVELSALFEKRPSVFLKCVIRETLKISDAS